METVPQTRRKFITTVALLLAACGLLTRYLIPRSSKKRQPLASAAVADVPVTGALIFRNERVALLRDEKSFYAISLVCTHLGCTVTVAEDALSCPCHGSRFDRLGAVVKGPADKPLMRMELVEHDGVLEVYSS